ncbi:MAG: ion transporter [Opitutaceae bacterium]|nr:ion transporter [Opitutaceae bacterium]
MITLSQNIVRSRWFKGLVVGAILLAGAIAGAETDRAFAEAHAGWLRLADAAVLATFVAEIGLKLLAHGRKPWLYFTDAWNVFDFVIVAACLMPLESSLAGVLRLARVLRVLRLVSALPRLQLLIGALFRSIGAMGYVCILLALVYYVYAVAGVEFFATAAPQSFGSLSAALLTLSQIMTLDNWSELYASVQLHKPIAAAVYFFSFILIGTMIMLNLFIGIVMNSMTEVHAELEQRERVRSGSRDSREDELRALAAELRLLSVRMEALRERSLRDGPRA